MIRRVDELMRQVDRLYERAVFNGEYAVLPAADSAPDVGGFSVSPG
jgi:hypothetical protein